MESIEETTEPSDDAIELEVADEGEELVLVEEVEAELVLPVWEATGEPRVDAALEQLTALDPDDVHGHAEVFDSVHRQLREALTDLEAPTS